MQIRLLMATTALALGLGLSLSSASYAADADDTNTRTNSTSNSAARTGTTAGPIDLESLLGRDVINPNGDKIGDVDRVIIDGNGQVRYLVVGVGGFLGIGERNVAIPWDSLTVGSNESDKVRSSLTRDQLAATPEYRYPKDVTDRIYTYDEERDRALGIAPMAGSSNMSRQDLERSCVSAARDGTTASASSSTMSNTAGRTGQPGVAGSGVGHRVSKLVGLNIGGSDGSVVGEIDEILLDATGKVNGVVVDGEGDPRVMAWQDVTLCSNGDQDVVASTSLTADQFQKLPIYNDKATTP